MKTLILSTVASSCLFLAACSAPPPPTPPEKTVFDPLLQDEQRARDVQKTVDASAEQTRRAVENQERGDTAP